ncbi:MAG: hypothetical protein U0587_11145 [Candidatus Binatia bacterium]
MDKTLGPSALAYTNRRGETYYLHQGQIRTGKLRYFVAKFIDAGALPQMPPGFEFTESINGVVSVRRTGRTASLIPAVDLDLVRTEISRHRHLRYHEVEAREDAIIVYEPDDRLSDKGIETLAELFGSGPLLDRRLSEIRAKTRYWPVIKLVSGAFGPPDNYVAYRMSYRGAGGWRQLSAGPLCTLLKAYVRHIGTEKFFDLL